MVEISYHKCYIIIFEYACESPIKLIFSELEEHKRLLIEIKDSMNELKEGINGLNKKFDILIEILKNK
ncbi:hypothetical protein MetfoDRAFT_1873 [Methanotorris formicicus Mc-S-70]|uniref:Uncharacterized protein n=1 Tax=Methanotorris formicicus Mc-S-70 TaxID=647171 RepID=H1L1E9_9EURY|nr:hypothetical protein MetfoDRAFT_1873 [Methanotorris formicicus Mc-S-70]